MNSTPVILLAAAAATAEAQGLISGLAGQFHLEVKMLLAQIVNFGIVAAILWYFGFKKVTATLVERQERIAQGLQYAEDMKAKLAEAEAQHAETLKEAQQQAQGIVAEAREAAKALLERETKEAAAKAQEALRKAQEAMDLERQRMLTEVREEVARLVVLTSARVLNRELSEQERSRFSDSAAQEIAASDN